MMRYVFALLFALSVPAQAEKASLKELSAYLNTLDSVQADFVQFNADNSKSTGTLSIKRPGRARFQYDAPDDGTLVLASAGTVAVFDGRSSARPDQYPLSRTPLKLILARNIDLTRIHMVTGHGEENGRTIVQAQDPEHPEYGKIYLYFDRDPLRLTEWLIISESGERTRVKFQPFRQAPNLKGRDFSIQSETARRQ